MISVIIPALNEEKYIESTLKAIRNQDYKDKYEIIVVDGKSKDKTVKIARKYADKVITVKQRGAGAARNAGAKLAKGEILLFIDADTMLLFNALTEFDKAFKKKYVIGATCPVVPLSSKVGDFILYWFHAQFEKASIKVRRPQIVGLCCAYRKDTFKKIGGFNEEFMVNEDHDLSKRIAKFGKFVFVKNTLALTSSRRLEAWGRAKAIGKYITIYINNLLTGKGYSASGYRPVR